MEPPAPPPPAPPPGSLPPWLRLADAGAVGLGLLVLWRVLTGGSRGRLPEQIVALLSLESLLFALGSVLLVRHVARPSPSVFTRLGEPMRRAGDSGAWGPVWRAFIATRLMVFVVAFAAVTTIGMRNPGFVLSRDVLVNLPARYDAGWYGRIATSGYDWNASFERESTIAFFPAMPLLMRLAGSALGARDQERPRATRLSRMLWSGVAVSLTAFFFALYFLVRLGTRLGGQEVGANAALLLACYPFAFAFSAPYTESLFLLASVASVYHFQRSDWTLSGAWGLVAGLTRPNGFFLTVPLALVAAQQAWRRRAAGDPRWARASAPSLASALMPVAGMMIFTVYLLSLTGVWFAWSRSHGAWGRTFQGIEPLAAAWQQIGEQGLVNLAVVQPFNTLNALGLVFALVMIPRVYRTMGVPWAAYVLLTVVPALLAGGVLSMGRLTSTLFPVFLALAATGSPRATPAWAAAFAVLQGLCVALFFTWRQLY
jgi:hypothetical protein